MSKILAQGMITLTQLYEGVQVILSPTAVLIPCDSEENPKPNAYINASTNVKAFLGTMDITSGITLGELEYSDSTVKASKTETKVSITAITTRTGYVDIPVSATINGETIDLGKHRFNFVKQIDGQPGIPGDPGFGYTLNIKGGTRGVAYAANGTNPEPKTSSQFSVELLKNGVKVANPASISWTCGGNLSGASSVATFTPAIKSTYNSESSYVKVSVKEFAASLAVEETIPIICTKHADGLDWINEWNNQYVQVGTEKIITPKIFAGTKNSANELTGVAIGRDVLGGNANKVIGIVGYKKNTPVFSLDQNANFFVSSSGSAGDVKNGTNNAKGLYFDGNDLYISGRVRINGGSTIGESNTSVEEVINNSNLGAQANNKLDNLSIGGRNYIQYSDFTNNTSQWAQTKDSANTGSSTVANGVMTIISSGSNWIQRQIYSNKTATALLDIKNGQTYTASIEMMVTEASTGTAIADLRVNNTDNSTSNKIRITQDLSKLEPNVWTKVQSTSKITYDEKTFNYWRFIIQGALNQTVHFRKPKLELGNKATDWTPAPEDINSAIDSKANSTDVYTKTETYSKTQTDSAIEVAKDEINLGVSSTYETKTNVESKLSNVTTTLTNKIDGVQIGGRNLLLNSGVEITNNNYGTNTYIPSELFVEGETYTVTLCVTPAENVQSFRPYLSSGMASQCILAVNGTNKQIISATFKAHYYSSYIPTKPTDGHAQMCFYRFPNDGTVTSNSTIHWVKVEKGNKPTDYSPAPEDIQANIDTKANSTDVYTKSEVFTKVETNSAINVAKNEINLGISSTYETKENVETKVNNAVNNIQIGGRNLIPNSNDEKTYGKDTLVIVSKTNNFIKVLKNTSKTDSNLGVWKDIIVEPNTEYTVSFRAGYSDNGRLGIGSFISGSNIWSGYGYFNFTANKLFTKTFTTKNGETKIRLFVAVANTAPINSYLEFINLKFEKGNKATDWSPSPEDVDSAINSKANSTDVYKKSEVFTKEETNSQINIAKEAINLGVSNTYETKSNVENKINTAVNNIQIGGRNLAKKGCLSKYNNETATTVNDSSFLTNGGATISRTAVLNEGPILDRFVVYEAGKPYNMSFKLKANTDGINSLHIYNGCSHSNTKVYIDGVYKGTFAQDIAFPTDKNYHRVDLYFNAGSVNRGDGSSINTIHTILQPMKRTSIAYTMQVLNFTISAGNKPMDWMPAPEDINNSINSKANSTDVYTKSQVYTKEETNSQIKVAKDEINLGVSNTYETKANVETKVNNAVNSIQVGGRNLIKNSNKRLNSTTPTEIQLGGVVDYQKLKGKTVTLSMDINVRGMTNVSGQGNRVGFEFAITHTDNTTSYIGIWHNVSDGNYNGRKVRTFTVPNKDIKSLYYNGLYMQCNATSCDMGNVKLEEGNKATSWTPAPEDIDSALSTKANSSDVYTKLETYTKIETDSAIKVAKDEINLGVSQTYETKTNVETKVNNAVNSVQVGGRNLVNGTAEPFVVTHTELNKITSKGLPLSSYLLNNKNIIRNKYITFSIDVKTTNLVYGTTNPWVGFELHVGGNTTQWLGIGGTRIKAGTSDGFVRYVLTTKVNDMDITGLSLQTLARDCTGTVELVRWQIEIGNRATDWKQSPEDIDSAIGTKANSSDVYTKSEVFTKEETNSQINIAKDAINLGVSQTYETKTDTTTKINNAVNGIKIGGTNLITKKSGFVYGYISSSNGSLNNSGSLNYNQDFYTNDYFLLKTGESVCFASYPKSTVNSSIEAAVYIHVYNSSKVWQKAIYHTNTANATANKIYTATEDCYIRFCSRGFNDYNHMAEYATKPSQWSPAPEDVANDITNAKTDAIVGARTIPDRRNTNDTPQYYFTNYPKQTITEFKYSNVLGIVGPSVYGTLETKVPWSESSGGYPVQIFRSYSTATFERKGTSNTTWSAWTQVEDVNGSQAKANVVQANLNNFKGTVYTKSEVYTKTETNSQIKAAKDEINLGVSKVEEISKITSMAKMLYTDVDFRSGLNGISTYNNAGNGNVVLSRVAKSSDCPTKSTHMIQITTSGSASPGHGGFTFGTSSRANAVFITKFLAKIPSGYSLSWHSNPTGDGGKHEWLTSTAGTGKWTEYICKVTCGASGSFSSTNYFALNGGSAPVTWYLGMATVYDLTDSNQIEKRMETAEQKITSSAIISTVQGAINTAKNEAINSANSATDNKLTNYATKSTMELTAQQLRLDFSTSGGNNLVKNSMVKETSNAYGFATRQVDTSLMVAGKKYTLTFRGRTVNGAGGKCLRVYIYTPDWSFQMNQAIPETSLTTRSMTFVATADMISKGLVISSYHHPNEGDRSGRSYIEWYCVTEGEYASNWTAYYGEIYNGNTIIDADGITVNNGALRVKNKSGSTVLSGDSNGNLTLAGNITSNATISGGTISGGVVRSGTTLQNSSAILDSNGLTINNGAIRVKNKSGSTVLSSDSNGNLTLSGNITSNATISGGTITGGTLKSTNGDMRFDMNNGIMLLYNNGTKIGQTNKNSVSGTNIYGISNSAEYGSYACLSAKLSSNASLYSLMVTAAGNDLPNANIKKGVNLGQTLHSHNWDFKLGSSTYLRWRQNGSNFDSFITEGSEGMLRLYGDNGMYLGYRAGDSNNYVIAIRENGDNVYPRSLSIFDGDRPAADNNGYSLEISAPLNMKGQSINQCSNIKTLGLEFIEPIAFNRDGEDKVRTLKVTKSTQNIVEFIGSVAIKNGEAIVDLPNDVSFKNYVVLLTPIGLDRKVSIVEKNDDNFKIVGNDGIVDYVIKFESMDYASYISKSISEDNTDIIVRSEEDKPKEIFLEN